MAKAWNIGNTTVRNPKRIEMGLKVMAEKGLLGDMEGQEKEEILASALVNSGVVDSQSDGEGAAWLGRKWRSVMVKLGFITDKKYKIDRKTVKIEDLSGATFDTKPYTLTPVGQRLITTETSGEIGEIFLNQLLKHELPNPIEIGGSKMKPLVLFLEVLMGLRNTEKGLNQREIAIFLQCVTEYQADLSKRLVEQIIKYRTERDQLNSSREKKEYDQRLLTKAAAEVSVRPTTPMDYADTTVRYFSMTGLFELSGSRIQIKSEKIELVSEILNSSVGYIAETDPVKYLNLFYSNAKIIKDEEISLRKELGHLVQKANSLSVATNDIDVDSSAEELKRFKYKLEENLLLAEEDSFALNQQNKDQIEEILTHMTSIASGDRSYKQTIVDMPAHLEWVVWRGFLSIDHIVSPISSTRGFPVDADLKPRYPAPGGRADMLFEFEDFFLVVEVTLTTSVRQYIAECEPVRRHVAEMKGDKPVYGLFIAPSLDNNFLHGLREYYRGDELVQLTILPITLVDFAAMIEVHKNNPVNPSEVRDLILRASDGKITNAIAWKDHIISTFQSWVKEKETLV